MHLSSIFKEYGVEISQTKLVRHPLNKQDVKDIYNRGMIEGIKAQTMMPKGYPYPEHFNEEHVYYNMKKLDLMSNMDGKLVIEWGQATRSWFQWLQTIKRYYLFQIAMKSIF